MALFKVSKKAGFDLVEIGRYTENKFGINQRNKYLDLINFKFIQLSHEPSIGFSCNEIRKGYFRLTIEKHIIFYRKYSYGIRIIRVLHHKMDWSKHL